MSLNCLIVDDDIIATRLIQECVARTEFLELVGVCSSVNEAIQVLQEKDIDLIFLDVEMPEINGIEFIKTFKHLPLVILITSSKDYAAEAFDYDVTGYLLKPVDYSKFLKASLVAKKTFEQANPNDAESGTIFVKENSRLQKINTKEITYIEALADYVIIYTAVNRHTIHSTMKAIESKLNSKEFIRIHRSFIVRLDQIKAIENQSVSVGLKSLPIGLSYKDNLFKKLNLL
jgi:DNA-binding LytR/AlgR family response regulator